MFKQWLIPLAGCLALLLFLSWQPRFFVAQGQPEAIPNPSYPVHPDDLPLLEQAQQGKFNPENGPVIRPAPEYIALIEREELQRLGPPPTPSIGNDLPLFGPANAGAILHYQGREVKLPADVYPLARIVHAQCPVRQQPDGSFVRFGCGDFPEVVLGKIGSDLTIRIDAKDKITTLYDLQEARKVYAELLSLLDAELQEGEEVAELKAQGVYEEVLAIDQANHRERLLSLFLESLPC
jgi:hypothetical protein